MYELHVWGRIAELPSFDADCLAAMLYLELADGPTDEYLVVPSSNPLVSPDMRLPALRKDGKIVASGILEVLRFLKSQDVVLPTPDPARDTVLSTYVSETLQPISLYIQRLHVLHFQYIFRPGLFALLPPSLARYAASLWMMNNAKHRIAHVYNLDLAENSPDNLRQQQLGGSGAENAVPGFSFFKKQTIKYAAVSKDVPQSVVDRVKQAIGGATSSVGVVRGGSEEFGAVMRMLSVATEGYAPIEDALSGGDLFLFGDRPGTADVFLIAHLLVQTVPSYSVSFVNAVIDEKFPRIKKYIENHRDLLKELDEALALQQAKVDPADQLTVGSIFRYFSGL
ncbi:hypothetical protein BZA70DRAFT_276428 [Myxozyma melibiosi]|uniref:Mitochondrial outer membrane transport complex Sam37/metaxin N-terminal domain-containing protein n=1 Tax=Myxozyma melibiosi TaxID=54550 RepID=A0ABR1FB64_9ASCO